MRHETLATGRATTRVRDSQRPLWVEAARVGALALAPTDTLVTAARCLAVLRDAVPDSCWSLTMADPVTGGEHQLSATAARRCDQTIDLRTQDGRHSGRLAGNRLDAVRDRPGFAAICATLAGLVDWMRGPIWITAILDVGACCAIVTEHAQVIPIPGRVGGPHLVPGSELVSVVAGEHPAPGRVHRFWWQAPDRSWHRVRVLAGPSGAIVIASAATPPHGLSSRELSVITLVAKGLTNVQAGRALGISERTVAKHMEHILRKTNAPSRAVIAYTAVAEGMQRRPVPAA